MQWPDPYDPGRLAGVREEARRLFEETDYLVVADIMCLGPFEGACFLRGYEQFCMDLYWNLDMAHAILDKVTETDIALWDLFLQNVGDYVQVVAQGDDLGTQRGTWITPEMYRELIKPYHKRLYDFIHSKTQAKVFMHSCGSVFDLIPDLIEAGVEILNPIQRSAAKMDIATHEAGVRQGALLLGRRHRRPAGAALRHATSASATRSPTASTRWAGTAAMSSARPTTSSRTSRPTAST